MILVDHLHPKIETGEEPNKDARQEDDRSGLINEGVGTLPDTTQRIIKAWQVVSGELHHKRGMIAAKHLGFLQEDTGTDDG